MCVYNYAYKFMKSVLVIRKINDTPKGVYLPISKLHSILALANLLKIIKDYVYILYIYI